MRIAINGFGRIGRTFLRVLLQEQGKKNGLEVAVINCGPMELPAAAHLFKFDTTMGTYPDPVAYRDGFLHIGPHKIALLAEVDLSAVSWEKYGIEWVVDCSGRYTHTGAARAHLAQGAKRVLISAPAPGADCTIIPGINDGFYDPAKHHIVSLGSCTTNALLPLIKVLQERAGIENAAIVTVHSYTNAQALLDGSCKHGTDLRRCRTATENIIPTGTGAGALVGQLFPELAGKVSALALRVPVSNVSLVEVHAQLKRDISVPALHEFFTHASQNSLQGIVALSHEPLVSSDFLGNSHSVIIDTPLTTMAGKLVSLYGWYDNEWGYSCRLRDFLAQRAQF